MWPLLISSSFPHDGWLLNTLSDLLTIIVSGTHAHTHTRTHTLSHTATQEDTRMDLSNTATQEETLLIPRNQQMVVGQNLQLPPNHLFGDNSQLVVGVSHTRTHVRSHARTHTHTQRERERETHTHIHTHACVRTHTP